MVCLFVMSCQNTNKDNGSTVITEIASNIIPSVEVIKPSTRSFNSELTITGTIKPDKSVVLHAMEQGFVKSISVDIGDRVSSGQVIARLSNPMLSYEVKAAEVKVKEAQAQLRSAQAHLKLNEAEAKVKKSIYDRLKSVYDKSKGLTTITELENAQKDSEIAMAQKEAAMANIDRYKAEIDAANSMVSAIKERSSMLSVKAPFSGVITGRFVDPGAMIQNALTSDGAMPIVSIESTSPSRLSLPLAESDISGINVGDEIDLEFPTMPGEKIKAKISRIARSLDPASKTMEVQVDLPNKDGKIKAGMYAKAKIRRASSSNILSLPQAAILMRKDAPFVMLVNQNNIVEELLLKKGISGRDHFEVLNNNINANSQIIIKGKSTVKAGQKVKAILK